MPLKGTTITGNDLVTTLMVKPQRIAESLLRVADGMGQARGCEAYVVNAAPDEPDTVWVTEVWSDAEASEDTKAKIGHAVDLAVARSACTCEQCGNSYVAGR